MTKNPKPTAAPDPALGSGTVIDHQAGDTEAIEAASATVTRRSERIQQRAEAAKTRLTSPWASLAAVVIAVLWTVPTVGLLVNSTRAEPAPMTSGWWKF